MPATRFQLVMDESETADLGVAPVLPFQTSPRGRASRLKWLALALIVALHGACVVWLTRLAAATPAYHPQTALDVSWIVPDTGEEASGSAPLPAQVPSVQVEKPARVEKPALPKPPAPPVPVASDEPTRATTPLAGAPVPDTTPASDSGAGASGSRWANEISAASAQVVAMEGAGSASGRGVGQFVPASYRADYLQNPDPPYPERARRLHYQGSVLLRVHVTPEGRADIVRILTSSGYPELDNSAKETVQKKWRFVAATQGGRVVDSWVKVPVKFKLDD